MLGSDLTPSLAGDAGTERMSPPALEEVMAYLHFGAAAQKKLLAGEIISSAMDEATDRELAVSVAMLESKPLADVVKTVRSLRDLDRKTEFHVLGDPPDHAGFAAAGFKSTESAEAGSLLKATPGSTFNLSAEEYKALSALAQKLGKRPEQTPAGLEAINGQCRQMLRDRYAAYRAKGLSGVARYDRGDGKGTGPQDDLLAAASSSSKFVSKHFPAIQRSLLEYPNHQAPGLEHQFFWSKQSVEDRPTFILSHRAYLEEPTFALIVERQFYVGHSYNAMQIAVGCLPHGKGTLVFYTNRTATDRVAGLGSGLAHKIGRGRMRDEIVESFKRIRDGGK
jgi:hypothetical protein